MPTRTPEQAALIRSLPVIPADTKCNARKGNGYCKNLAGFRTDHLGTGRCYLHGGNGGRPVSHALYSVKLNSTLAEEYERLIKDPALIDLYAEMAFVKIMIANFIGKMKERMVAEGSVEDINELDDDEKFLESDSGNWMIQITDKGNVPSAELNAILKILEMARKIFKDIVDAETKAQNNLSIKNIFSVVSQIKTHMNSTCGICPVRKELAKKLNGLRMVKLNLEDN